MVVLHPSTFSKIRGLCYAFFSIFPPLTLTAKTLVVAVLVVAKTLTITTGRIGGGAATSHTGWGWRGHWGLRARSGLVEDYRKAGEGTGRGYDSGNGRGGSVGGGSADDLGLDGEVVRGGCSSGYGTGSGGGDDGGDHGSGVTTN
ncbi:glycine-rich cell wall structural protein 1.8-like [Ipomoea triloba]|uniref:glycine-rich cell wall structural protein 1.8-like n=1 Tax=Ipomoea triloba TaxID=35885 RepID=UPI00125DBBC6|nr:glycine-rich cell wall structural protein 1.8-like [Ipomoea triloba]